jgi:broad specificity phosphatase PhoE
MKLVLIRHAQKGITPYENPALNETGLQQAEELCQVAKRGLLPTPTHAWVSPRVRTFQTLQPLCESLGVKIQVTESLDQRTSNETAADFQKRISAFLNQFDQRALETPNESHILCTHYDWIEESLTLINADKDLNSFEYSHWSPSQFLVFEIALGTWKVIKKGNAHAAKID